jgi:hypothetical protein
MAGLSRAEIVVEGGCQRQSAYGLLELELDWLLELLDDWLLELLELELDRSSM